jgi:hypothetical protein
MDASLKTIKDGWEKRDARGQRSSTGKANLDDDAKVRAQADKYVKAHAKEYAGWDNLSLETLVAEVERAREVGDEDKQWQIEAYLLHRFEPQNIGGPAEAVVRIPNG